MTLLHKSLLALAVVAIVLSGCTDEAVARPASAPVPVQSALPPLRVVVFVDQTTSMDGARVAPVMAAQFAPVYERLVVSGGELAVGLVRDDSDRPFARLFVPVVAARDVPRGRVRRRIASWSHKKVCSPFTTSKKTGGMLPETLKLLGGEGNAGEFARRRSSRGFRSFSNRWAGETTS